MRQGDVSGAFERVTRYTYILGGVEGDDLAVSEDEYPLNDGEKDQSYCSVTI